MKNDLNKRTLTLEKTERNNDVKSKPRKWNRKDRSRGLNYKGKKANDPLWHGKNSQLIKDLCAVAFNHMQGFPLRLGHNGNKSTYLGSLQTIGYDWFAGVSQDFRSMLNTAATNIWEFIRSRNAGATNYQFGDIFTNIVLGALDIVSTVQFCTRAFGVTNMYTAYNRLTPRQYIMAMGIDFDDFNTNISIYRGKLNILIAKASSLVLPKQFPIYDWVGTMCSNIYKDRESTTGREQHYMVTKKFFHIFDATSDPNGGLVRLMTLKDVVPSATNASVLTLSYEAPVKFSLILSILEKQIDAIISDEDCNIIMGDLIKAYGSEAKFWSLRPVSETEEITPIYSEEVLSQIHNAVFAPTIPYSAVSGSTTGYAVMNGSQWLYTNTIKQNENHQLVTEWSVKIKSTAGSSFITTNPLIYDNYDATSDADDVHLLIDSNSDMPSPDEVMTMTRFQCRFSQQVDGDYTIVRLKRSSAIVLFMDALIIAGLSGITAIYPTQTYTDSTNAKSLAAGTHFDWYPILYNVNLGVDSGMFTPFGDLNNCVPITGKTLERMHEVDFASLYDVPFTGKF